MKAFEFEHQLIDSYARFSRSFTKIRADDLSAEVERQYDAGRFWPDAMLSLNPRYLSGPTVDDLVSSGDLDEATGKIFRFGSSPLRFHRHQAQSIAKAKAGQSYVVTTGTGSGKSLCFFVPVVDAIIRARKAGKSRGTRAIIVYPMNALANSQLKEIEKFIDQSGLSADLKPVVRRYTGQESQEERQRIASNPPDILLTNFMMAELLLTRQDALDTRVIENASALEFIVLDELHTYRGRQGADVAVLVRRLRNRCAPGRTPICIGTSATMASEGDEQGRAKAVASVASRIFGASIGPDAVIDESLLCAPLHPRREPPPRCLGRKRLRQVRHAEDRTRHAAAQRNARGGTAALFLRSGCRYSAGRGREGGRSAHPPALPPVAGHGRSLNRRGAGDGAGRGNQHGGQRRPRAAGCGSGACGL